MESFTRALYAECSRHARYPPESGCNGEKRIKVVPMRRKAVFGMEWMDADKDLSGLSTNFQNLYEDSFRVLMLKSKGEEVALN